MIDKTGKKIIAGEPKPDSSFMLAEIKFFMKAFRNDSDDKKALDISRGINDFLKAKGDFTDIKEILLELEIYSRNSRSDDFVWQLVYIRRFIRDTLIGNKKDLVFAAECSFIAARHFEKICELKPTLYNRCCRVQEYANTAISFAEYGDKSRVPLALDNAKKYFAEIEEEDIDFYYSTGKCLYTVMFVYDALAKHDIDEKVRVLEKLRYHARQLYRCHRNYDNLNFLSIVYQEYFRTGKFPYKEEEENLKQLISLIEKDFPTNLKVKEILRIFKDALKKCQE